ncbi:phosphotransferase family protein [Mycobacteroides chelonae]|uniref:Phosphotransferase family protein n=1 Tax=Mycobacteroides chelonae TaxID=1774 RepID=A0AB73TWA6_MYCCH|nr:phosphotransferase family protein [Mycobacteroides chelonae]MEC4838268.1 phosphotransferase family protein [Mycobacteroides chelonae]MEC4845991.1 phosphotransferase family protein [Mycobacteroides chelonae]OLT78854.1 aminoglycoside phosphotransferase [Mycobacteroides chelonae]QDF69009.1 phosphotransferase family protein [Mycobacteroides chelonae]WED90439.1 phosphotransferase family protein [Mycobacteroides chelonae]
MRYAARVTRVFRATAETTTQDWSALSSWVARQGHVLDASAARQFAGGKANLNYLVALDGRPAVFRRPPAGPIAEGANDMAREWRVLSRLNAGFALAPRGLLYCDDLDVLGAPFQFLEYREGLVIGGELPAGLPGEAPERITATLIEAMTSLHAVKPESVGLGDLGKPEGFLERQLAGWTRRAHAVWPEGLPAIVTNLTSRLEQQIPEQSRVSLLHMDLKLDNMLVDRETLSPNAVIDWDMATRGCPLFDLAILTSYWMEPGDPTAVRAVNQMPTTTTGFASRRDVIDSYFTVAGMRPRPLHWQVACARLRLGVAWMQLYRKWQCGDLVGAGYADFEDIAMAVLSWAATQFTEGEI